MVETESRPTIGLNMTEMKLKRPDTPSAICSDFFMAMRLGTSSPNMRVKYESTRVMTTTAMFCRVWRGIVTPRDIIHSTRGVEKLSAANALPKKPDRVMAT